MCAFACQRKGCLRSPLKQTELLKYLSHAAAYAVVSYQTAYLKANYPVEFMAAVMNCDLHLTDKLAVYKREVDKLGIVTVAPSVNDSLAKFTVREGCVVYALGALKGVGVEAMALIVDARGDKVFATLFDFARRVDMKRVGKRPLELHLLLPE